MKRNKYTSTTLFSALLALAAVFILSPACSGDGNNQPEACQHNYNCSEGMICSNGVCVNKDEAAVADAGNNPDTGDSKDTTDAGGGGDKGSTQDKSIPDKAAVNYPPGPYGVNFGDVLPNLAISNCSGSKLHKLSDYYKDGKHKVILVTVHTGWCSVCKRQSQNLEAFYQKNKAKGLMVWMILTENYTPGSGRISSQECSRYQSTYKFTFPTLRDPGAKVMRKVFDKNATPLNMIVDLKTMKIVYKRSGLVEKTLNSIVESYL